MRVAVVGGGAIGLACAWYLSQGGAEVVVVERDLVGEAASLGNGGLITPGLSNPLPAPGVMGQALRWMLSPDSPFLLRFRLDPAFAAWCWRFWRSCSQEQYLIGMRALLALGAHTVELFDGLAADGVEFEMHDEGLLFLFRTQRGLEKEAAVLAELQREGYRGAVQALTSSEARTLDPAVGDSVIGALHAPAERHVRPETLTRGLAAALRARGAEVREGARVESLVRDAGAGWRLRCGGRDDIAADRVVVACGPWTGGLLAPLGVQVRQEPAKGYSVTATGEGVPPRHPLYLSEAKVVCTPFAGGVRLAGTVELAGFDLTINRCRLAAVAGAATDYLRDWRPTSPELEWAGLRPLSADGLPLIGRAPGQEGLFVATGHGKLGITLAPATGAALAPLVLDDRLDPELVPLRLDR